jgi:hypothetical protein
LVGELVLEFDERRILTQRSLWVDGRTVLDDGVPAWMGYDRALRLAGWRAKCVVVFAPFTCGRVPCDDLRCAVSDAIEAELRETYEHGARYFAVRADEALGERLGVARRPALVVLGGGRRGGAAAGGGAAR